MRSLILVSSSSLVVQTSFLGDVVLTTPLIASLARRGPVDVITTPAAAPLLANNRDVRHVLAYDKRAADRGAGGLVRFARRVRAVRQTAGQATVAYLAQGSLRSAALALLIGAGERVGFETSGGRALYTRRVPYRRDHHHAERLLGLADVGGAAGPLPPDALRPRLYPGPAERAAVDALLDVPGVIGGALIALAPGSVWATKRWPYYAELAADLLRRLPSARIALVGGALDAQQFVGTLAGIGGPGRVVDATGRLDLLGSAELIRRAAVLVTNDSAPQHLASAVGTPTVTVFGPTVPEFGFGPLAPGSVSVGHEALACRPCDAHGPRTCPLGHWRCMLDLGPARVGDQVVEIVNARA